VKVELEKPATARIVGKPRSMYLLLAVMTLCRGGGMRSTECPLE